MSAAQPARFAISNVQITESHFTQSGAYAGDFNVTIEPSGIIQEASNQFLLRLEVKVTDASERFEAQVVLTGTFLFDSAINEIELTKYFVGNAPAMLFPHVRSYIAALTALSGFATILLPALNLESLAERLRQAIVREV